MGALYSTTNTADSGSPEESVGQGRSDQDEQMTYEDWNRIMVSNVYPTAFRLIAERAPDHYCYIWLDSRGNEELKVTFKDYVREAMNVAAFLQNKAGVKRGDRVLLVYPPGYDFLVGFFACFLIGAVNVPLYPPNLADLDRSVPKFEKIAKDSGARVALTNSMYYRWSVIGQIAKFGRSKVKWPAFLTWQVTNALPGSIGEFRAPDPPIGPKDLAFLQYTSGSTADPKGVMVSHGNLQHQVITSTHSVLQRPQDDAIFTRHSVSWLPQYHDMGLIGGCLSCMICGLTAVCFSPIDFIKNPWLWAHAMSKYRAIVTVAPNFAFELLERRVTEEQLAKLDFTEWHDAMSGAEPVRAACLRRFSRKFASANFKPEYFNPCYGTTSRRIDPAPTLTITLDQRLLEREGRVVEVPKSAPNARTLVGCGYPAHPHIILCIGKPFSADQAADGVANPALEDSGSGVAPTTLSSSSLSGQGELEPSADGPLFIPMSSSNAGEVLAAGPSAAQGYYNMPEKTRETFRARVVGCTRERPSGVTAEMEKQARLHIHRGFVESMDHYDELLPPPHRPIWGPGPAVPPGLEDDEVYWVCTGDLGFFYQDQLFICGRMKDLVIVNGRNIAPQDVEETVEMASRKYIRPGCSAAFSVEDDGQEQLCVVAELRIEGLPVDTLAHLAGKVMTAIFHSHDVACRELVLIKARTIAKTTSGKIKRHGVRAAYLEGSLKVLHRASFKEQTRSPFVGRARYRFDSATSEGPEDSPGDQFALELGAKQSLTHDVSEDSAGSQDNAVVTVPTQNTESLELQHDQSPLGRETLRLEAWMIARVAAILQVPEQTINPRASLAELGLDSTKALELIGYVERHLNRSVESTVMYEYPSIELLAAYFTGGDEYAARFGNPLAGSETPSHGVASAVIGIGCRLPGAGRGPQKLWEFLLHGGDGITDDQALLRPWCEPGGYLDGVGAFDRGYFGISRAEATAMDPQQGMVLETIIDALEDAGLPPVGLRGSPVGVCVGGTTVEFAQRTSGPRKSEKDTMKAVYRATGTAASIIANRASYIFDFRGPSMVVDTACSSALVASFLAVTMLNSGHCSMAIAGGVNLLIQPTATRLLRQAGFLSPTHRCHTFDEAADGYVRSEGVGMVVLRSLDQALEASDRIYAQLMGGSVNQDGHSNGLTAPNGKAQDAVLRAAYGQVEVNPATVSYVEAHGTGTALGDPVEVNALSRVMCRSERSPQSPLRVGSIKTNMGHLECAAGIAGLIKLSLSLFHETLPTNVHFKNPNPLIHFEGLNIVVQDKTSPWPSEDNEDDHGEREHVAGVSSFGFGGTNAHMVLRSTPHFDDLSDHHEDDHTDAQSLERVLVLPLSARSANALSGLVESWKHIVRDTQDLPALCLAAAVRREHHAPPHRVGVVADQQGMEDALQRTLQRLEREKLTNKPSSAATDRPIVFVFSGQGPQWWGMGRQLYHEESVFRSVLDQCHEALAEVTDRFSLIEELIEKEEADSELFATDVAQPVLVALHLALAALWRHWGIVPDALVGHSLGELAAACVGGVLSLKDTMTLASHRGRIMQRIVGNGKMVSIEAPLDRVLQLLREHVDQGQAAPQSNSPGHSASLDPQNIPAGVSFCGDKVSVAAVNGKSSTVLSGAPREVDMLAAVAEENKVRARFLPVTHAFHSQQTDALAQDFVQAVGGIQWTAPKLPLWSTLYGCCAASALLEESDSLPETPKSVGIHFNAQYWVRQIRAPVLFKSCIGGVCNTATAPLFVEIGPHPVLSAAIFETFSEVKGPDHSDLSNVVVHSMRRGQPDVMMMHQAVARLYEIGASPLWQCVLGQDPGMSVPMTSLPMYPWHQEDVWDMSMPTPTTSNDGRSDTDVDDSSVAKQDEGSDETISHPLLGRIMPQAQAIRRRRDGDGFGKKFSWTNTLSTREPSLVFVRDHRVNGSALLPGAAYIEMISAAALKAYSLAHAPCANSGGVGCELRNVRFHNPLYLIDGESRQSRTTVTVDPVSASASEVEAGTHVSIFSRRAPANGTDGEGADIWLQHATADVIYLTESDAQPTTQPSFDDLHTSLISTMKPCLNDVDAILLGEPPSVAPKDSLYTSYSSQIRFYMQIAERNMDLGPTFQVLEGVWMNNQESLSKVVVPSELDGHIDKFGIHPAVLDACLQLFGGFQSTMVRDQTAWQGDVSLPLSALYLPVQVKSVTRFAVSPHGPLWAFSKVLEREASGLWLEGDVTMFSVDEPSRPVVHFHRLRFQRATAPAERSTFDSDTDETEESMTSQGGGVDPSDRWLFRLEWAETSLATRPNTDALASTRPEPVSLLVVVCSEAAHCPSPLVRAVTEGLLSAHRAAAQGPGRVVLAYSLLSGSETDVVTLNDDTFSLGPSSSSFTSLFSKLGLNTPARAVLHSIVCLVHTEPSDPLDEAALSNALDIDSTLGCMSLLHVVQACQSLTGTNSSPRLWIVTNSVHPDVIGSSELAVPLSPINVCGSAVWGFGRVINQERRLLRTTLVDLAVPSANDLDTQADAATAALVRELLSDADEEEVAFRGSRRFARMLRQVSLPAFPKGHLSSLLRHDRTYVISGGTGGFGLMLARWMAALGDVGHIVLLARRPKALSEMKLPMNAPVSTMLADVCHKTDVQEVFESIQAQHLPPIAGVIHAAGTLADKFVGDQNADSMHRVMDPKMKGLVHMHQAVHALEEVSPLDFFVVLSSAAAVLGNPGQANYAAANAFMDGFVEYRRSMGLAGTSINWGPLASVGMFERQSVTVDGEDLNGIVPFSPGQAISVLQKILAQKSVHNVMALRVLWPTLGNSLNIRTTLKDLCSVNDHAEKAQKPVSEIEAWLVEHVKDLITGDVPAIDPKRPLSEYALDSIGIVGLANSLGAWLDMKLTPTILFDYPSIDALSRHLGQGPDSQPMAKDPAAASELGQRDEVPLAQQRTRHVSTPRPDGPEPIGIVGMSCRFPGRSSSPAAYWDLLINGRDGVIETPPSRWDVNAMHDPDMSAVGKINTRFGGYLQEDLSLFDAKFFSISEKEALVMDPQQRILLELAWESFEDAGQDVAMLAGTSIGVFIGIATEDYGPMVFHQGEFIDSPFVNTGNANSIAANRISYIYDLRGPSMALDTACSSALVATHLAAVSMAQGESCGSLVGGSNLILTPLSTIGFSKGGYLAPDGKCKTWDASANGYARAEGMAIVFLKPLTDARRDRDRVYAAIRGSAINQDGKSMGMTAPNGVSQEACLKAAYKRAGLRPGQVHYVELHGTGTSLGDPVEARAVGTVMAIDREPGSKCLVGTVKTNFGHSEAAAGIAGLIKLALSIHKGMIPPNLHFKTPNPMIPFDSLPVEVSTVAQAWPNPSELRTAGISGFGFGGANAHVVVTEDPEAEADIPQPLESSAPGSLVFALSAASGPALHDLARAHAEVFRRSTDSDTLGVCDVCYTLAARRSHHPHRLALVLPPDEMNVQGLATTLSAFAESKDDSEVTSSMRVSQVNPTLRRRVCFVFSGQGPQYLGMCQRLYACERVFREMLQRCDAILQTLTHKFSIVEELMVASDKQCRLDETEVAQPVLVAVHVALAALWKHFGVEPEAVLGHSLGEIAAAHIAGVLTLEDCMLLAYHRGRIMQKATGSGAMCAARMEWSDAENLLSAIRSDGIGISDISLACNNSPRDVVFSGAQAAMDQLEAQLSDQSIRFRRLPVQYAFHSPKITTELQRELFNAVNGLVAHQATLRLFSTVTGHASHAPPDYTPEYWSKQMRRPVQFVEAVRNVSTGLAPCNVFVEIGPQPVLIGYLSQITMASAADGMDPVVVSSLRRKHDDHAQMYQAVCDLYTAGLNLHWHAVFESAVDAAMAHFVDLPRYQWQHQSFWTDVRPGGVDCNVQAAKAAAKLAETGRTPSSLAESIALASASVERPLSGVIKDSSMFDEPSHHPLLGRRLRLGSGGLYLWRSAVVLADSTLSCGGTACFTSFLLDHKVNGGVVFPAAGYIDLALAAASDARLQRSECSSLPCPKVQDDTPLPHISLREVTFLKVLNIPVSASKRRPLKKTGAQDGERNILQLQVVMDPIMAEQFAAQPGSAASGGPGEHSEWRVRILSRRVWVAELDLQSQSNAASCRCVADDRSLLLAGDFSPAALSEDQGHKLSEPWALHAVATAVFDSTTGTNASEASDETSQAQQGLQPGFADCDQQLSVKDFYNELRRRGLQYGECFRGLRQLAIPSMKAEDKENQPGTQLSQQVALGHVAAPADVCHTPQHPKTPQSLATSPHKTWFQAHPALVDAGMQVLFAAAIRSHTGCLFLPVSVERVQMWNLPRQGSSEWPTFGALPEKFLSWGKLTSKSEAYVSGDVTFYEETGTPIGRLSGLRAQFVGTTASGAAMTEDVSHMSREAAQELLYRTVWKNAPLEAQPHLPLVPVCIVSHHNQSFQLANELCREWQCALENERHAILCSHGVITDATDHLDLVAAENGATCLPMDGAAIRTWVASRHANGEAHAAQAPHVVVYVSGSIEGKDMAQCNDIHYTSALAVIHGLRERTRSQSVQLWHVCPYSKDFSHDGRGGQLESAALHGLWRVARLESPGLLCTTLSVQVSKTERDSLTPMPAIIVNELRRSSVLAPSLPDHVRLRPDDGSSGWTREVLTLIRAKSSPGSVDSGGHVNAPDVASGRIVTPGGEGPVGPTSTPDEAPTTLTASPRFHAMSLQCLHPGDLMSMAFVSEEQATPLPPSILASTRAPPPEGHVEISVRAVGLNFRDVLLATGMYPTTGTMGSECAGVVSAVGAGVSRWTVGDEVVALSDHCFRSFAVCPQDALAVKPASLSWSAASATPVVHMTVHYALHHVAGLSKGSSIIVHSAAGGIGLAAVQSALTAGAEIFATAGTPEKRTLLKELGVHHVMDSRTLQFADQVMDMTGGRGVDVVLNSLAGEALVRSTQLVAPGGHFIEIGKRDVYMNSKIGLYAFRNNAHMHVVALDTLPMATLSTLLDEVMRGIENSTVRPPYRVTSFSLAEASVAFQLMGRASHIGKVAITFDDVPVPVTRSATQQAERLTTIAQRSRPICAANGSYLVTGGLGEFGSAVGLFLAAHGAGHVVLAGRSATPAKELLERLEGAKVLHPSCTIECMALDVADADAVTQLLRTMNAPSRGRVLRGIFHAAGVRADAQLANQTAASYRLLAGAKVAGAWNLHSCANTLLPHGQLDHFVLFSSVASVLGNPGQANYASVNTFMDALAQQRVASGQAGLSVSWGPVEDVGMFKAVQQKMGAVAQQGGPVRPLSITKSLDSLEYVMSTPAGAHIGVWNMDFAAVNQLIRTPASHSGLHLPLFRQLGQLGASRVRRQHAHVIKRSTEEILAWLIANIAGYMTTDTVVDPHRPLAELGLESVGVVGLSAKLGRWLGVQVPPTVVYECPTLQALAEKYGSGGHKESDSEYEDEADTLEAGAVTPSAETMAEPFTSLAPVSKDKLSDYMMEVTPLAATNCEHPIILFCPPWNADAPFEEIAPIMGSMAFYRMDWRADLCSGRQNIELWVAGVQQTFAALEPSQIASNAMSRSVIVVGYSKSASHAIELAHVLSGCEPPIHVDQLILCDPLIGLVPGNENPEFRSALQLLNDRGAATKMAAWGLALKWHLPEVIGEDAPLLKLDAPESMLDYVILAAKMRGLIPQTFERHHFNDVIDYYMAEEDLDNFSPSPYQGPMWILHPTEFDLLKHMRITIGLPTEAPRRCVADHTVLNVPGNHWTIFHPQHFENTASVLGVLARGERPPVVLSTDIRPTGFGRAGPVIQHKNDGLRL